MYLRFNKWHFMVHVQIFPEVSQMVFSIFQFVQSNQDPNEIQILQMVDISLKYLLICMFLYCSSSPPFSFSCSIFVKRLSLLYHIYFSEPSFTGCLSKVTVVFTDLYIFNKSVFRARELIKFRFDTLRGREARILCKWSCIFPPRDTFSLVVFPFVMLAAFNGHYINTSIH